MRQSGPGAAMRVVYAAPARLYRAGFGWLLGQRFLCLEHIGRKSGRRYRTVLEVVGKNPSASEYIVVVGYGPSSDWFRNIQANPASEVTVGRHRFAPQHRVLGEDEATTVIADYERRNRFMLPIAHRVLSKLLGWRYDGSDDARQRMVRQLPVVAFRPRESGGAP